MSLALKYDPGFLLNLKQQNIFTPGVRLIELFKLMYFAHKCKRRASVGAINYVRSAVKEGDTVLNLGENDIIYVYLFIQKLKGNGKLITIGTPPYLFNRFLVWKNLFNWQNLILEPLTTRANCLRGAGLPAKIIDFAVSDNNNCQRSGTDESLDQYCKKNNLKPDFIKVYVHKNENIILSDGAETIKKYRPRILLVCEERLSGKETITGIFKFLTGLNYSGYFFLDTIRIPLINFDFDIYQNPCRNFYCSHFIFE